MTMMTIPSSIKTLFNTFPLVVLPPLAHPPVEIQFGKPDGETGETLVGESNGSRLYVLRNDPISLATHLYYTSRGVSHTVIYTTRDSHSSHPFMIRMTSLSDPVSAILNESRTDDTTKAFCSLFEGPIKTAYDSTTTTATIWSDTFEDGWMAELEDAKIAWEAVNTYLASKTSNSSTTTGSETWADAMMFGYAHMILSTTSTDSGRRRQVEMKRVVEKQTRIVTWRNAMLKSTNLDMI